MNGRKCDDTIHVRLSAVAVSVTLMCAEMGIQMLERSGAQEYALNQITSVAEAVKNEVARKIVKNAAAEKETKEVGNDGDEQND